MFRWRRQPRPRAGRWRQSMRRRALPRAPAATPAPQPPRPSAQSTCAAPARRRGQGCPAAARAPAACGSASWQPTARRPTRGIRRRPAGVPHRAALEAQRIGWPGRRRRRAAAGRRRSACVGCRGQKCSGPPWRGPAPGAECNGPAPLLLSAPAALPRPPRCCGTRPPCPPAAPPSKCTHTAPLPVRRPRPPPSSPARSSAARRPCWRWPDGPPRSPPSRIPRAGRDPPESCLCPRTSEQPRRRSRVGSRTAKRARRCRCRPRRKHLLRRHHNH
mmetsp:Transcript_17876/g.58453  ORF Transcript_17876/g.58453 Transcript_17876/m.58453 type:complete len:274 (+) Transcript_17876:371-1192(+)